MGVGHILLSVRELDVKCQARGGSGSGGLYLNTLSKQSRHKQLKQLGLGKKTSSQVFLVAHISTSWLLLGSFVLE